MNTEIIDIFTFEINSRETYLAFRAEWKRQYKSLSVQIRSLKNAIKNDARRDLPVGSKLGDLWILRKRATDMLEHLDEVRAASKAARDAARSAALNAA